MGDRVLVTGISGFLGGHVALALLDRGYAVRGSVRNLGNRTFYRRDGQWIDSRVSKEQQANAKHVKQFSDEYFTLAKRYGRTRSQYFAFDEPVLLNLDGQAYLIEP